MLFIIVLGDMIIRFAHPQGAVLLCSTLPALHYGPNMLCRLFSSYRLAHKVKPPQMGGFILWSGRHDSNMRHLAPKASTLPG